MKRLSPAAIPAVLLSLWLHPAAAAAQPASAVAPTPAQVSGVLVPEQGDQQLEQEGPSALLAVPRLAVTAVAIPVRGGLELYERHHLKERVLDLLFDDTRTYGIYPAMGYESGFGFSVGARLVHRDLDGRGARLRLGADVGGQAYRRLEAALTSAPLASTPVRLRLQGGWQRQPNSRFFGIGEADLVDDDDLAPGTVFPGRSPQAVGSRFRQDVARAGLALELDPRGPLFANLSTTYLDRRFGGGNDDEDESTPALFDVTTLPGWQGGSRVLYTELQLGLSTLGTANPFIPAAAPSHGTKLTVFGGLGHDPRRRAAPGAHYLRYGVDALRYFDLFAGDRVLVVRGYLEGVAGDSQEIPFTDLPRLGGPGLLRGHDRDRFRDKVAMLGTVEYRYPVWRQLGSFLFIDAGRVLAAPGDVPSALVAPDRLHLAAGAGLEIADHRRFHLRGQVSGSRDGVFFQLSLEPLYGTGAPHHRI